MLVALSSLPMFSAYLDDSSAQPGRDSSETRQGSTKTLGGFMAKAPLELVIAACLLGCTTTSVIQLTSLTPPRPLLCPAAVRVFASPGGVGTDYKEVAVLIAQGSGWVPGASERQLITSLRQKAATIGANGVILGQFQPSIQGSPSRVQATAIWVPADSVAPQSDCRNEGETRHH